MKKLPASVADEVAKVGRIKPSAPFRKYLSVVLAAVWRGDGAKPRALPRRKDATKYLDRLLRDLRDLEPEKKGEVAGAFLAAVIVPQSIEDWVEKIERARFNATENPQTRLAHEGAAKGPRIPGFGLFLSMMLPTEKTFGCKWTAYASEHDDRGANGSLLDALTLLAPYLPSGFVPKPQTLRDQVRAMRRRPATQ